MKRILRLGIMFLLVGLMATPHFANAQTATGKHTWHRITDEAALTGLKKLNPYLGKATSKTVKDKKQRVILTVTPAPKVAGEDSILNVTLTEYSGNGSSNETKLQLHATRGRWYTYDGYSDKAWLYATIKKMNDVL